MTDVHEPYDPPDTEELLLRARDQLETRGSVPMSASVMVNRDDLLGARRRRDRRPARGAAPGPLAPEGARGVPGQGPTGGRGHHRRRPVAGRADGGADRGRARGPAAGAQQVVDDAEATARNLKHEAEDYIDQKLASFEVVLDRTMQAVQKGRERLQVVVGPARGRGGARRRTRAGSSTRTRADPGSLARPGKCSPCYNCRSRPFRGRFQLLDRVETAMSALRCNVADLLHHPAARRPVHFETDATELGGVGGARLDDQPLFVEAVLERVPDGVVVQGTIRGFYAAQCSRCLRPVHREVVTAVRASCSRSSRSKARPIRSSARRSTSSCRCATRCCSTSRRPVVSRRLCRSVPVVWDRPEPVHVRVRHDHSRSAVGRLARAHLRQLTRSSDGRPQAQDPTVQDSNAPRIELAARTRHRARSAPTARR